MKTLRKNWERLAHDLADVDTFQDSLDLKKITKKLTRFYFRNVPPEKSPVHNFANVCKYDAKRSDFKIVIR